MKRIPSSVLKEFVAASREIGRRGLIECSSGNLSMRLDEERAMITTSRSWKGDLTADQVCVCSICDAKPLDGRNPSVEAGFHAAIFRERSDVNVVLHFQSPSATALACMPRRKFNFFVIPEVPYYIGPVARIPFFLPGSRELVNAVGKAMGDHDMALLTNHGQVTVGRSFAHVIQNAEFFELACGIIARTGGKAKPMPAAFTAKLLMLRQKTVRSAV